MRKTSTHIAKLFPLLFVKPSSPELLQSPALSVTCEAACGPALNKRVAAYKTSLRASQIGGPKLFHT
jgi:hypothetical protein